MQCSMLEITTQPLDSQFFSKTVSSVWKTKGQSRLLAAKNAIIPCCTVLPTFQTFVIEFASFTPFHLFV